MAYGVNTTQQPITLTTTGDKSDVVVFAKQYDSHSRFVRVVLKDYYGKIPVNSLVQMNAIRPNGLYSFIGGIIEDTGALRFGLTTQILSTLGTVTCDVSVYASTESKEAFTGDGTTSVWVLNEKFYRLYKVKINGEETNDWTYNNKTFTLTLDTAPADGDTVLIEGLGSLVLTSQEFYIEVVASNNPLVDIEKENEFTTITVLLSHIYDLLDDMEGWANTTKEYRDSAGQYAQEAADNKNLAFAYKEEALRQAELATVAAGDADNSATHAQNYAENASVSAESAQAAATSMSFATFGMDENGHLIIHRAERLGVMSFSLNYENGHLEVSI